MRVSHRFRFVFLSNRKCGSSSVRHLLDSVSCIRSSTEPPLLHHISAFRLRDYFEQQSWNWNEYFSFCYIRNPWERVISQFNFARESHESKWRDMTLRHESFYDFLNDGDVQARLYRESRIPYLKDTSELLVSEVFPFEKINDKPAGLEGRFNLPWRVPHLNRSSECCSERMYCRVTERVVADIYYDDIVLGKYDFPYYR